MPPKVDRGKRKATEAEVEAQEHVAGREIESRTTRDVAASSEQQAIEEQQSPQSDTNPFLPPVQMRWMDPFSTPNRPRNYTLIVSDEQTASVHGFDFDIGSQQYFPTPALYQDTQTAPNIQGAESEFSSLPTISSAAYGSRDPLQYPSATVSSASHAQRVVVEGSSYDNTQWPQATLDAGSRFSSFNRETPVSTSRHDNTTSHTSGNTLQPQPHQQQPQNNLFYIQDPNAASLHLNVSRWIPPSGIQGVPQNLQEYIEYVNLIAGAIRDVTHVTDPQNPLGSLTRFLDGGLWIQDPRDIESIAWIVVNMAIVIHQRGVIGLAFNSPEMQPEDADANLTFPNRIQAVARLVSEHKAVADLVMRQQYLEDIISRPLQHQRNADQAVLDWQVFRNTFNIPESTVVPPSASNSAAPLVAPAPAPGPSMDFPPYILAPADHSNRLPLGATVSGEGSIQSSGNTQGHPLNRLSSSMSLATITPAEYHARAATTLWPPTNTSFQSSANFRPSSPQLIRFWNPSLQRPSAEQNLGRSPFAPGSSSPLSNVPSVLSTPGRGYQSFRAGQDREMANVQASGIREAEQLGYDDQGPSRSITNLGGTEIQGSSSVQGSDGAQFIPADPRRHADEWSEEEGAEVDEGDDESY